MRVVPIILIILVIVFGFGLALHYNQHALNVQRNLEAERYNRIIAEEGLEKVSTKIDSFKTELAETQKEFFAMQKRLAEVQSQLTAAQDDKERSERLLKETQLINADLTSQLEGTVQAMEVLKKKVEDLEQKPAK